VKTERIGYYAKILPALHYLSDAGLADPAVIMVYIIRCLWCKCVKAQSDRQTL